MADSKTPLIAAGITAAAAIVAALIGLANTSRAGQQITIGNVISNVFNFQGATINSRSSPGDESTRQTTIGGPAIRFGVNANALVSAADFSHPRT